MIVKVRNKTSHSEILYSADGDSIQINPQAVVNVDEKFLVDFNKMKIQVLTKKTLITEVSSEKEEVTEAVKTEESKKAKNKASE